MSNYIKVENRFKNYHVSQAIMVHAFNPSTEDAKAVRSQFKASLVYRATSGTVMDIEKTSLQNKKESKTKSHSQMNKTYA